MGAHRSKLTRKKSSFDSLPNEILVQVFSYLGHRDLLKSRLVNKRWCGVITCWPAFKNSVVYHVDWREMQGNNAMETLSKSDSCWSQIRFHGNLLTGEKHKDFRVLEKVASSVVHVEVHYWEWTWKSLKLLITMFSNLSSLSLEIAASERYLSLELGRETTQTQAVSQDEELVEHKWVALVQKLQSLTVKCLSIHDVAKIMIPNFIGLSHLVSLELHGRYEGPVEDEGHATVQDLLDLLNQTIVKCEKTLKTLVLDIPVKYTEQLLSLLGAMVSNGDTCLDLARFDLGSFQLCSEPVRPRILEILQPFVCTQHNLVDVTVPRLLNHELANKDLILCLPRKLRSLKNFEDSHLFSLLYLFPNLRHLETCIQVPSWITSRSKFSNMRHLTIFYSVEGVDAEWPVAFPNLTELTIHTNCDDLVMQAIIKNLKLLRTLDIACNEQLTDFGVTGIQNHYFEHLVNALKNTSRKQTFDGEPLQVPSKYVVGEPLSSLKGLNKLSIYSIPGCDHKITDAGILFGFRFNELRSLEFKLQEGVTDRGLEFLGRSNPHLETIKFFNAKLGTRYEDFFGGYPKAIITPFTAPEYRVQVLSPPTRASTGETAGVRTGRADKFKLLNNIKALALFLAVEGIKRLEHT